MNIFNISLDIATQEIVAFSNLGTRDLVGLIHPAIAVIFVFPIIGIVNRFAWQTRQRRLEIKDRKKSKIPPVVGREHVQLGKWLTASVVGVNLIGLAYSLVYKNFLINFRRDSLDPVTALLISLLFVATIATFILLFRARAKLWRGIFATLSGMGLIILGAQEGVWRLSDQWYWSHYYYGMGVSLLMIFSLAIVDDIYKDRTHRWRKVHIWLNCFALLLFIGQGITGARDLLEISPIGK
ncbi:MAG: DUF4079 domain-containing protein [Cyanobacteria bacterium P01_F01_bin.143]